MCMCRYVINVCIVLYYKCNGCVLYIQKYVSRYTYYQFVYLYIYIYIYIYINKNKGIFGQECMSVPG